MKMKLQIPVLLIFFALQLSAQDENLLSGKFSADELKNILIPHAEWVPFPKIDDRAAWAKADKKMLTSILEQAESYSDYTWPNIPATKSLLFERTGDRNEYQSMSFKKRGVLGTLVLAEIHENKGRFLDAIIDGVWSICEESFWGVPAHLPKTKEYSGLMNVSEPFVDLFAAETGTYLAWVDYFLGEKLDSISPQIRKRIYYETNSRLFNPLMNKAHGWMTKNENGRAPNNWNPWICSNWLNTALLLERNDQKRAAMTGKILQVLDEFLNPYPQDGGCDEGPSYWGAAAASLYDNISMLNHASNNAFQYAYEDEKIRNMGKFIYRAQISDSYFLNFADADPQPKMSANMIYRYGKDIKDPAMMKFGAYYRQQEDILAGTFHFFRKLYALFIQEEFQNAAQGLPLPQDVWLPDLQVMVARDQQGNTNGFYVAAKGGHNDESHNHNDIGNFVVYYDGQPLIIDVGRGTYTRKTFSDKRYDIWYNCSDYHNTPTVNEKTQLPGKQFKASDVLYKSAKSYAQVTLDIGKAYPEEAAINTWKRTIRLNRGKNVSITDVIDLKNANSLIQHMMTCYPAEVIRPGELLVHFKDKAGRPRNFIVNYDSKQMEAVVEKIPLTAMEDQGIIQKWGDNIYRINFKAVSPTANDRFKFEIARQE
jgi:hypothetical protein